MNNKVKYIIYIIIFVLSVMLLNIGYETIVKKGKEVPVTQNSNVNTTQKENSNKKIMATDFIVYDKENNPVKLRDFKGKPIVVNFWASWCGPCRLEMPEFNQIYEKEKDNIVFMMVNATDGIQETKEKATSFIEKEKYSFPVYFDKKIEAVNAYGINGFPTTLFINKDFEVVAAYQSRMSAETLIEYINKIK